MGDRSRFDRSFNFPIFIFHFRVELACTYVCTRVTVMHTATRTCTNPPVLTPAFRRSPSPAASGRSWHTGRRPGWRSPGTTRPPCRRPGIAARPRARHRRGGQRSFGAPPWLGCCGTDLAFLNLRDVFVLAACVYELVHNSHSYGHDVLVRS